jgi:hypothetical protein
VLKASRETPWSGAPDCPVAHRTVSGAPGGLALNSSASGFSWSRRAIIHRTVRCTPDSVRCSKGTRLWNSPASGFHEGCSAIIHRTCPVCTGLSGASSEQRLLRRQRLPAVHLMRAQRAQKAGAPIPAHRTVNSACPVRHRTSRRAPKSELQRSDSNGRVTWLSHRTCPVCTGLSGAPYDRQLSPTARFWLVAINTTPTGHFKVWEPKQHSKSSS